MSTADPGRSCRKISPSGVELSINDTLCLPDNGAQPQWVLPAGLLLIGGREADMIPWEIQGREFVNCNCAYGCPCQFNALPTHGRCEATGAIVIDKGRFGDVSLDGAKIAFVFWWPGAVHEGR